jgi:hypothetical protein
MTARRLLGTVLLFAAIAIPAIAQTDGTVGYDPKKPCRFYVIRKLPVPARCLAELQGNWSARPYIDGEFVFRSYEEYLNWRDRDDYRHWKAHDFAFTAGASAPAAPQPAAPPVPPAPRMAESRALLCPVQIRVRLIPQDRAGLESGGWTAGEGESLLQFDPSNPPNASGAMLSCTYALGGQRGVYLLSRPAPAGRCVANAEGTGFSCMP